MTTILITSTILISVLFLIYWMIRIEEKLWNNGVCKECGKVWIFVDLIPGGCKKFTCGNGHIIHLGWINTNKEK